MIRPNDTRHVSCHGILPTAAVARPAPSARPALPQVHPSAELPACGSPARSRSRRGWRPGFSSILATFYVTLFSGLALSYVAMSGLNAESTGNARREQAALAAAESGLSIIRYHVTGYQGAGSATPADVFAAVGQLLQDALEGTTNLGGQHVTVTTSQITVPTIPVDIALPGATFSAVLVPDGETYRCTVTGRSGGVSRSIRVTFEERLGEINNAIMQNGIVSRGSVSINGAAVLRSNAAGGCGVMSLDATASQPIRFNGSGQFQGDFYMVKEGVRASDVFNGSVAWGPPGGSSYPDTIASNHVHSGIDEPAWPDIDVSEFTTLINTLPKTTVTSSTNLNGVTSLHNVYIQPNANPRFNGGVTITGLIYVAWPNNVTFNGAMNLTGLIICQPPPYEPSVTAAPNCSMTFNGALTSNGVASLPDTAEYAGLRDKTGTCLIAKDYDVRFNGSMGFLNGTIYTSGLTLNGSTAGTVRGSIIVDRRRTLSKNGSMNLFFEVSAESQNPAGFQFARTKTLGLRAGSYEEV